jgi:hypothetical protein
MKLISKTLHYIVNSNETTGMMTEKILCDILQIQFNSKRDYITDNIPNKLKKDISNTLSLLLPRLQITQHIGNTNGSSDFLTSTKEFVSLKTNINGFKVCPQKIGQTTLQKINQHFKTNHTKAEFKIFIMTNCKMILIEYLKYSFICKHLISIKYDLGKIYYFNKTDILEGLENIQFSFTNTLENWNESNTVKIKINDYELSLAEFQIHNNRNCIKCRFMFDTIIQLIKLNIIKGILLEEFDLKYKYIIKVIKNKMIEY